MPSAVSSAKRLQPITYQFELKGDLESIDDRKLALAELQSLTGEAGDLGLGEAASASVTLPSNVLDLQLLQSRLAFWKVARTSSPSPGALADSGITQSQALEATARVKPSWSAAGIEPAAVAEEARVVSGLASSPSPSTRKKNDYLSHPFHKYKAKFFPRLARSLINITCPDKDQTILDPFCGSGTACVEASLMGMDSIGLDIDPLSVFISRVKSNLQDISLSAAIAAHSKLTLSMNSGSQMSLWDKKDLSTFKVPTFLIKRGPKRLPEELVVQIERQINRFKAEIGDIKDANVRDLFLLILSHAIATKISLRWMGTGDDRFALEVASRSLTQIFFCQAKIIIGKLAVYRDLHSAGVIPVPGRSRIAVSEAAKLPLKDGMVDGIATSPPYLPAASGRETYLRSRASSIIALGLMTEAEILETETRVLGSVLAKVDVQTANVPASVLELADWMRPQRERTAKANPTVAYFENLRLCLGEMSRVLKRGGKAALVVSKEHTFWELTSREVLRKFDMAKAVVELATAEKFGVGFSHLQTINLELPKMDFAARPGAKGAYSEAIILLQKS